MTQARDLADGKFDTSTLVVDAANNRVGIGTTSPAATLNISEGSGYHFTAAGGNATSGMQIGNYDGSSYSPTTVRGSYTRMDVSGTEVARFTSNGLTFNGDTAAANALDDYEEGTWTPTIGGTATYHNRAGYYIKIGKLVFITGLIHVNAVGTGATNNFQGLPYGGTTGTGREAFIGVQYFNNLNVSATYFALRTNGTQLYGSWQASSDGVMGINPSFITASTEIAFAGCYYSN